MVPLSDLTERVVQHLFSEADRDGARRLLEHECADNLPFYEGADAIGLERVRLGVLRLSRGNLSVLESEISDAKSDWRDILMAAGFGEDVGAHLRWFNSLDLPDMRVHIDPVSDEEAELQRPKSGLRRWASWFLGR